MLVLRDGGAHPRGDRRAGGDEVQLAAEGQGAGEGALPGAGDGAEGREGCGWEAEENCFDELVGLAYGCCRCARHCECVILSISLD